MTSFRQWQANRRNAAKSTGPVTPEGKDSSRRNALRHGLTAETVIGALEDAEDYKAFEAAVIADYDAQSAVERELVLRLASALWRLRRATALETALFAIEADRLSGAGAVPRRRLPVRDTVYAFRSGSHRSGSRGNDRNDGNDRNTATLAPEATMPTIFARTELQDEPADPSRHLAQCFLRLANLPTCPLDRLSRYEHTLWRQVAQILFALDSLNRRKPQERRLPMPGNPGLVRNQHGRSFEGD